jgi:hypothetical protein
MLTTLYPYEERIVEAEKMGFKVYELPFKKLLGYYEDGAIGVDVRLSFNNKNCIISEETGHGLKNVGNILDQRRVMNRRQELLGRAYAYDRLVSPRHLVNAFLHGCCNLHDTCEYLNVPEWFFNEAIYYNARRYGHYVRLGEFEIRFNAPSVNVRKRGDCYSA